MLATGDLIKAQNEWGDRIVEIGRHINDQDRYTKLAEEFLESLYAYEYGPVLFKPALTSKEQFRLTKKAALSYFIGGNSNFSFDSGFALNPWIAVRFENAALICEERHGISMGNYFFTDLDGNEKKFEYTMGFILTNNNKLRINVHHSSLPFSPTKK